MMIVYVKEIIRRILYELFFLLLFSTEKIIKAKWKGLRDNFRIQWKMIPRNEHDELMIAPEDFAGTKWYKKSFLFKN